MLKIDRIEMLTPLGNAEQSAAAVDAGINVYEDGPVMNRFREPLRQCFLPEGSIKDFPYNEESLTLSARRRRILNLAATTLSSLFEDKKGALLPLLMVVPEKLPGMRTPIDDRYFKLLHNLFPENIDPVNSYVFPLGRAGLALALDTASELLETGISKHVIIGGVDSYSDVNLILDLERQGRVLANEVIDGFAPAEGAGFLVVSLSDGSEELVISSWGKANEPGHMFSDQPYTGEALANSMTAALAGSAEGSVEAFYANLNGENFFSKEFGVAQIRNSKYLSESVEVHHPADCFGDVGAAWGGIMLGLSALKLKSMTGASSTLVCASSELEPRSCVLIRRI